jgi:integrating conjugative element membrane protein (TIGR03747 family)
MSSEVDTRYRSASSPRGAQQRGLISKLLGALLFSLFASVVMEWVGIAFFWPEEGVLHSARMVDAELAYLNADFTEGLLNTSPSQLIQHFAAQAYYWLFEFTFLEDALQWVGQKTGLLGYALAAATITQLFLIRLGILTFSLPIYGLFAVVGASTGLSLRDIRRWSGGREYGRIYHQAKALAPKALLIAWIVYLALPVSLHPNIIILPCAVLFGLNVLVITASFKKYL